MAHRNGVKYIFMCHYTLKHSISGQPITFIEWAVIPIADYCMKGNGSVEHTNLVNSIVNKK